MMKYAISALWFGLVLCFCNCVANAQNAMPVLATPSAGRAVPSNVARPVQTQPQAAYNAPAAMVPIPLIEGTPMVAHLPLNAPDFSSTRTLPIVRTTSGVAELAQFEHHTDGTRTYKPLAVQVLDVMDRGEILIDTKEQVRVRGARVPSEKSTRSFEVVYARESAAWLKDKLIGQKVKLDFAEAARDRFGNLHGRFSVGEKGEDLLPMLLELGYARLDEEDLWHGAPVQEYKAAQQKARSKRLGIWSEL